jgi:hypothetical protein
MRLRVVHRDAGWGDRDRVEGPLSLHGWPNDDRHGPRRRGVARGGTVRRLVQTVLLAALFGAALPSGVVAQVSDVITGRVLGPEGTPLAGARVEVISVELETTRSALTGANGRYMILFPDGGGRYVLRISYLGLRDVVQTLVRGDEELLLANVTMQWQAIELDTIAVRPPPPTPGRGQTGEQAMNLSQDLLNRLPLPDLDPNTLAQIAAGVISLGADSLTGRMQFSVAGMSELLNQLVLDGVVLGQGGVNAPEEGVRQTRVTTSTFDVSRGGFAGGQVSMATARGTNRAGGALSYRFDGDALQASAGATRNSFTRHNLGGSWGGPILSNRLFYNASFQVLRNTEHRFALSAADPMAAQRSGVNVDSIGRFLDILGAGFVLPIAGQTGPYQQLGSDLRLQGRLDWNAIQRRTQSHTVSMRANLNLNDQDSTRISPLDLVQRGGDVERDSRMVGVTVQSRLRTTWTHMLNAAFSESWNDAIPFVHMPEGRVRVTSDFDDGSRDTRSIAFGGNRTMPAESYARDFQVSNELSILVPWGYHLHRLKGGGMLQRQRDLHRSTDNLFGTWSYASLADFEANRPDRYERALTERDSRSGRMNAGLFLGDTWRISQPLELTLGLRWDFSRLDQRPAYNPAVEAAFDRRTDFVPQSSGFSPRLGFSYRLSEPQQPFRSLTGGIGVYSGRSPTGIFSQAVRQTGLPDADTRLICIGDAVPIPDWSAFFADGVPGPVTCADGGVGVPPSFSTTAPTVTIVSPDQRLPSSVRAELGYGGQLRPRFNGHARYVYSRGVGLWGYRDLNIDESRSFTLPEEGRPYFGDVSAIAERTGATSLASSRRFEEFGNVFDIVADGASETHQFTAQVAGLLSLSTTLMVNYTLGFSRDEGVGGGGMMGGPPTASGPNERGWAVAGDDRRHTFNVALSRALSPTFEVAAVTRSASGSPFTPMVGADINGDGLRNDRASVFDPAAASDPAVAEGMQRLLDSAPGRIQSCLREQLGRIADRNSCRNGWSQSLDVRASLRPVLPRLGRRMTVSIDGRNVLTGLDQLFHGREHMRGWGEGAQGDATLLNVRGFDAATRSFAYEVNEAFGQNRRGAGAMRNPFALTIAARVQLGGHPALSNRGFGQGFGPLAGGFGAGSGGGGRVMIAGGRDGGMLMGDGQIARVFGMDAGAVMANTDSVVDALLVNPLWEVARMSDELALSDEQRSLVRQSADTLDAKLIPRREPLTTALGELAELSRAPQRGQLPNQQLMQRLIGQLRPHVEGAQRDRIEAMRKVREALGDSLWGRLPEAVRAHAEPPQPQQGGRGMMRGPGGARDFNAVATLDRMLANPVPVLLELRDTLGLSEDQVRRVQVISDELQRALDSRRATLGRRFDGVPPAEQGRIFAEMHPDIERGRREAMQALERVQRILTPEQWRLVPETVRNPFQAGRGAVRRPGGGG